MGGSEGNNKTLAYMAGDIILSCTADLQNDTEAAVKVREFFKLLNCSQ